MRGLRRFPYSLSTVALVLLLVIWTATPQAERRVALVIGNGQYHYVPRLANPTHDAQLIADTLTGLNFTLVGGKAQLDLDKAALDRAIQEFGTALQGASVAFFYYAGHGVQVRGANYLVPVSANPTREADVDFHMVNADLVLRQMEGAGTQLNLLILDACRNNPLAGRGVRATGGGLAQMQAPEGTLISYATQPGNVAQDGTDGHSPYTRALASALSTPGLDVFAVFNETGLAVKKRTGGAQQPWVASSPLEGKFYFAGAPHQPPTMQTPPGSTPASELMAALPSAKEARVTAPGNAPPRRLRNAKTTLSRDEAKAMIVTHDFYRAGWNEPATSMAHHYETQVLHGGLVVLDHATGLMWQKGGSGKPVQGGGQGAEQYVRDLNAKGFGGFADWRLPTLEEAMSLMTTPEEGQSREGRRDEKHKEAYHLARVFEIAGAYFMWTADLLAPGRGWVVYFREGQCLDETLTYNAYVRAVRSMNP
jgi:uncharacterized caspase-like protein